VARPVVSTRTHERIVRFFVDEGDERTADLFRELKAETEAVRDAGTALLEERCEADDWDRARATAEYLVRVAYDDYADALAGMGLDPEPDR